MLASAAALMAASAASANVMPISGAFSGDATVTPTGTPGVFTLSFSGSGTDAALGAFTVQTGSTLVFNPPNISASGGTFDEVFTNGSLMGTSSGSGAANGMGGATVTVDLTFTGGTGAFAGDTGNAMATGTVTLTSPTSASVSGSYMGSLTSAPEPMTWTMLLLGFAAIGSTARMRSRTAV